MARSLTVISLLLQSTTHCRYRVYTKYFLTYTAIYRRNREVLPLGITALQPQSHFHLGTPYIIVTIIFQLLFTNDSVCTVCRQMESFFPLPFKESLWALIVTYEYSTNATVSFPWVRVCRGLRLTKDFPVRRVKIYSTLSPHFLQAFALYFGAYAHSRLTFHCH
jgi:hypothetical protein